MKREINNEITKLFITTLLSVSVIGTAIPANVSPHPMQRQNTYTLKVAGKKQKEILGAIYNGKTIQNKSTWLLTW